MCIRDSKGTDADELSEMLNAWAEQSEKYHNGDINRDEYDTVSYTHLDVYKRQTSFHFAWESIGVFFPICSHTL